jgi:hypothetical protein
MCRSTCNLFFFRQVFAPSSHAKAIQARRRSGSLTMLQRLNAQRDQSVSGHDSEPGEPQEPNAQRGQSVSGHDSEPGEPQEPGSEAATAPRSD